MASDTMRTRLLSDKETAEASVDVLEDTQQQPRVDLDDDIQRFPDGLSSAEAAQRLQRFGPNKLVEQKESELMKFLGNFWGPMPIMIWIAIIVEAIQKDWVDFFVLLCLQLLNGCVSYYEEKNAGDAIAALKDKMSPKCSCKRDGVWDTEFDTGMLVPGDLVQLKLGDIVPADAKLLGKGMQCLEIDQAALTGESLPVTMFPGDIAKMGATIKKGELDARVAFTGSDTFFGKAAELMAKVVSVGRFQKVLFKITMFLLLLSIVLVAIILVVLLEAHIDALKAIGICVVLLVASIPIAMQVVSTSTMAVGSRRLAQKKVIVARLSAIEELAGMDMLCSDKTGTLTQNKLTLFEPLFPTAEGDVVAKTKELYLLSALAVKQDNREQQDEEVRRAGVQFAQLEDKAIDKSGAVKQTLDAIDWCIYKRAKVGNGAELQQYSERKHNPFDPSNKRTESKVQDAKGNVMWVVKGAPQVVLEMCLNNTSLSAAQREALKQKVGTDIQDLADRGYRALGVAKAPGNKVDSDGEEAALQWTFTGVLSLADPPREDTLETIERAYEHGVEVKMVTGDQTAIAKETCRKLNMGTNILPSEELAAAERNGTAKDLVRNADGFAEVFPETKFRIVEILQEQGFTCGMTGDGVNDAPALKKAQIGIAVSGATDAARAAADIVLVEDGLSVIIDAILRSRKIFQRVRNYGIYRVACTIQLVFFFFFAVSFLHPSDYFCANNENDIIKQNGKNVRCTQYRDPTVPCDVQTGVGGKNCPGTVFDKYPQLDNKCWTEDDDGLYTYQYNNDWQCPNVYPGAAYRFTLPVLAIVIITILNDVSIITIARDKVIPNKTPQQWQLPQLCTVSAILGFVPCLSSILLLVAGFNSADGYDTQFSSMLGRQPDYVSTEYDNKSVKFLPYDELLMLLYLKISISDFLTVFSARTRYWFFERRPGYALGAAFIFATTTSTLVATLATIPDTTYKMKPITGKAAGIVWAYNLIWFIVQDIAKLVAYWCFDKLNEASAQKEEERLRAIRSRRACVLEDAAVSQRNDIRASGALAPGGSALRGSFLGIATAAAGGSGALGSLGGSGTATDAVLEAAHKRIKALEASQATMARQIAELQEALKVK